MMDAMEPQKLLDSIMEQMKCADTFDDVIWGIQYDILNLVSAERITVYRRDKKSKTIVSCFKSGDDLGEEIYLSLNTTSIAGYVAMSQHELIINDVTDAEGLKSVHENLSFDVAFDKQSGFNTTSMMVLPIKFKDALLGVLQIINSLNHNGFSEVDLGHARAISLVIGEKFRYHLQGTLGPYDYLIKRRKISLEELEEFESRSESENTPMTQLLIDETQLTAEEIGMSLEQYYQVPFFKYNPDVKPNNDFFNNLNKGYLAGNFWLPLAGDENNVIVLIDDPSDSDKIMDIQNLLNAKKYEFMVGLQEDILKYLGYGTEQQIVAPEMDIDELIGKLNDEITMESDDTSSGVSELMDENASSIIQLVNRIIVDGIDSGASDIHIEPNKGKVPADVRMRVDGQCSIVMEIPAGIIRAAVSRIKVLSRLDITETRKPQDGKMAVKYGDKTIELRIATLPTINGESVVMRILASGDPLPFAKLNFMPNNEALLEKLLVIPYGIILVVGPTGSGKTTTLHALLGHINKPDKKILTAEDPVEITQKGLQQVQVQAKIGLTFAVALRSFLRCDPDVILIGEMRDYETCHAGIEASLTGHLVFSTLHTNSAPETVTRLLDIGLEPVNFADALIGILAQRLMRTLCKCAESYEPEQKEIDELKRIYGKEHLSELDVYFDKNQFKVAKGCPKCADTGYKGRTGIHELLEATFEMKRLISKSQPVSELRDHAIKDGMRTLVQDGVHKVCKGQSDLLQLRKVTSVD